MIDILLARTSLSWSSWMSFLAASLRNRQGQTWVPSRLSLQRNNTLLLVEKSFVALNFNRSWLTKIWNHKSHCYNTYTQTSDKQWTEDWRNRIKLDNSSIAIQLRACERSLRFQNERDRSEIRPSVAQPAILHWAWRCAEGRLRTPRDRTRLSVFRRRPEGTGWVPVAAVVYGSPSTLGPSKCKSKLK